MTDKPIGPKEQQLRNLRATLNHGYVKTVTKDAKAFVKASRKAWKARKKQQKVRALRRQINRTPKHGS